MNDDLECITDVPEAQKVLNVWFLDTKTERMDLPQAKRWFRGGRRFDETLHGEFLPTLHSANNGELEQWLNSANTTLAYIILLDQISRNIFRGTARAFENDTKALSAAKYALTQQYPDQFPITQRVFFYMPFMHDESLASQDLSVSLFETLEKDAPDDHINAVMNRTNSIEESEWLRTRERNFGQ